MVITWANISQYTEGQMLHKTTTLMETFFYLVLKFLSLYMYMECICVYTHKYMCNIQKQICIYNKYKLNV